MMKQRTVQKGPTRGCRTGRSHLRGSTQQRISFFKADNCPALSGDLERVVDSFVDYLAGRRGGLLLLGVDGCLFQ
jgi:hypothetical protein